jgi:hypothetical protein
LNISSATVDFDDLAMGTLSGGPYVFASYGSGMLTGTFSTILDKPTGYDIDYNYLGGNQIALKTTALPGDFNLDGSVDAADYVIWRKTLGDPANYDLWRANFGNHSGSGSMLGDGNQAVPEPAGGVALMICAALSLGLFRGNQRLAIAFASA